ncbi:inositol monophosphatase family protein [Hellea balneolensis]|uniref:inositol monophosphatase family protein n=1 Tax=Hellea balneolensis TaxID=287478 RepID=UPI0004019B6D|nr:inositol monophosphatase family protein [Hellea balneolensis]
MTDYSETELKSRLAHIEVLAKAARDITLPLFASDMDVINKAEGSDYDPVTAADVEGERAMRTLITTAFPDDGIEGEELPDIPGQNDWLWTLDPIDGTRGFVAGVPVWSTLIAVSYKNQPVLGLIDVAAQDKQFWGAPGRAWLVHGGETNPLKTKSCGGDLTAAILGCTEPLAMLTARELSIYNTIRRDVRFSRLGLDAYGYGQVAAGRMDIIIEALLKPCDVRALMPVIEGAGGKLTNWEGGSAVDGGRAVAVGDPDLLPELYKRLKDAPPN